MGKSLIENGRLNTKNYNEKVRKQNEVFSQIDSTMAILETLPTFIDSGLDILNADSFTFSNSPLGFLFNILKTLGVSEETLKKWIAEILVNVLPTVEIGVKAALLSNIKSLVSCNSDPRIPLRLRKRVSQSVFTNILTEDESNKRGIDINIEAIDPDKILDMSPFTEPGMRYYFGCTKDAVKDPAIQNVDYSDSVMLEEQVVVGSSNSRTAKLVRADDFNAFMWYVIHKGNRQNPAPVGVSGTTFQVGDDKYTITSQNKSLLGPIEIKITGSQESNIIAGNTFYDVNNPNYVAICIKSHPDSNGMVTGNTIVPVSSDWFSCNWYVDNSNYYGSNLGIKKKNGRDYSKEKAICNLRYKTRYDYRGREIPNAPSNIRFTILPKPYVLMPSLNEYESDSGTTITQVQWRPIRLLFDANGNADQNGKFSLISEMYDLTPTLTKRTDSTKDSAKYDVKGIVQGVIQNCAILTVNVKTGDYTLSTNTQNWKSALVECYPGLTVYEFNYDYLMGMKLFDPKVVCQRIFDNAANPKYNAFFGLTLNKLKDSNKYSYLAGKQKIIEIVQTILEEDGDDEINDCFFSFSNEQYNEMLRRTEELRYNQLPLNQGYNEGDSVNFESVTAILNDFNEDSSLEEQEEVITRALTKACDILDSRINVTSDSDKSTTRVDFLTDVLEQLVATIVDAVLSPKVLMLLIVNNELMNSDTAELLNTEQLLRITKNVVKSVVREVRDLIMQKILDYIVRTLTPLALQIQVKIASEQFAAYMAIIRMLLSWLNKGAEVAGRASSILSSVMDRFNSATDINGQPIDFSDIDLASVIDDVNYADIYPSDIKDKEPIINNC